MKRVIRSKYIIEDEWVVEIYPKDSSVTASSILDANSSDYDNFIQSMIDMFTYAGYELYNDPEYAHQSNRGSESWYYTFIKVEDLVEIRVIVNVRISDHPNKDFKRATAQERRNNYSARIAKELAAEYDVSKIPMSVPVDIVIDDNYCKSYLAAQFKLRDQIQDIEDYYAEWRKENGLE